MAGVIEDVIYARLSGDAQLASMLATWNNTPAIFQQEAPEDTSPAWKNGVQFPRIIYLLDRNPTQGDVLQGTLHVTIWARDGEGGTISAILARVHALMDGQVLYAPEDGLATLNGRPAEVPLPPTSEGPLRVIGVDVVYRVQVLPPNTTYEPDPVATLNRWSAQFLDARITVAPNQWAPSDSAPALYWRLSTERTQLRDMEWWGFWVDVDLVGHVLAPSPYARGVWTRYIADTLRLPGMRAIRMGDGSPLRINVVSESRGANPQTAGQLNVSARFGVLTRSVPTALDTPPVVPPGQIVPPPVWTPGVPPNPIWTPPVEFVSDIDTGQELDVASLEFVPDVETLPQPPS